MRYLASLEVINASSCCPLRMVLANANASAPLTSCFPTTSARGAAAGVDVFDAAPSLPALSPFGILLFTSVGSTRCPRQIFAVRTGPRGEWKGSKYGGSARTVSKYLWVFTVAAQSRSQRPSGTGLVELTVTRTLAFELPNFEFE